jgi:two-component system CheB/CheR fusion protein
VAKIVNKQYIIAIGASAGGLEAISAFFDYTPLDAVSYILIQHLSADFKSQMAQILTRHSKMEVVDVVEDMDVESNKVYLIPSSKFMKIKNGRLILSDKKDQQRPHLTIDHFFISLAEERGDKAIGIILSGTGHDGSKGVEAIKKAGGIVLVQDPDTATFKEMPLTAIATGYADLIISPQAMPQVIEDYVNQDGILDVLTDKHENISESELKGIIGLIKGSLPLDFTDYKRPTILRRIKRQMVQQNIGQVAEYHEFLKNNPKEIELLANAFLIGVTSFFRDPEAFKVIEKNVVPDIIKHKIRDEVLKIWVAGCATGEEAYSIAILVREYLDKNNKNLEVKIFATDINKTALDIASKGIYPDTIKKMVSKGRLDNFFTAEGGNYKVKHEIRKMLIFAQHDLVKNPPYCNIDLISCRNLLIYMNPILQKKVFSMMHFGLKKDGYLFLGPSESATVIKEDFSEISSKWNILQSNKSGRKVKFDAFSSPVMEEIKTPLKEVHKKSDLPVSKSALADQINLAILKESGFSGVCTDENLMVIQSFGNTSIYLKSENFNHDLIELLPGDFSIAFKAAAHKALKLNEKVLLSDVNFEGIPILKDSSVNVLISPFLMDRSEKQILLILFSESLVKPLEKNIIKSADISELTKEHVINLEHELAESKYNLAEANERVESTNENMQSFNEELQSANEEMQSANEEMQSTNEELQSVNEELQTINKEHQLTNAELTESNDDLNNYFRSNLNGQLFVDHNIMLKKYSPGAVKHINVRDSDIGRPLSNITTNIKFETLIDDVKQVMIDGKTITREAEASDGKVYQVMTMPYIRKESKKGDGAIISFYDITELKKLLHDLDISNKNFDKSNKSLLRINADLNNFVYGASHDLNAPILNIEMVLKILNKKIDSQDPDVINLSVMMNNAITNFKTVINDLGKIGLIDAEMLEDSEPESFIDTFEEITEIISERIKLAGANFSVDFQEKEVKFSKKYLRSIILNLITNAIKFCPTDRNPDITISTKKEEGFILLTVKDNGIGVEKDRIDFIFKMYQRINNDVEGQGVGLYLVKKIVDASGGKIEVESEAGKGSTFKIFFKI